MDQQPRDRIDQARADRVARLQRVPSEFWITAGVIAFGLPVTIILRGFETSTVNIVFVSAGVVAALTASWVYGVIRQ